MKKKTLRESVMEDDFGCRAPRDPDSASASDGDWPNLGRAIREVRDRCGVTQARIAQHLGITGSAISRIETRGNLNVVMLRRIARFLRVNGHEIVQAAERIDSVEPERTW